MSLRVLNKFDELVEELVQMARDQNPNLDPPLSCEFYIPDSGFCRITGSACPHFESTYTKCQVRSEHLPSTPLVLPEE